MRIVLNSPVGKFTALRNNKSCLSRRLVLSQPSQLVSSTFHVSSMRLFRACHLCLDSDWEALVLDRTKCGHACLQKVKYALCHSLWLCNQSQTWLHFDDHGNNAEKTWHTEWIYMCLFYCFHIFSSVLQSSAKCLSCRVTWTSGARSGLSGRKGFLGTSGWSLLWAWARQTQDRHNRSRGIPGNPGESVPGDSNDSKAKHPKHPIQSKHIETTCRALEAKRWWTKSRIPSRPLRPASSTLWSTSCVSADSLQILCRFCNLETLSASNLLWILFEISNITASWELRRTCGQTPKQLPWDSKCKNANLRQLRHSCFCLRALQVGWIKV